MEHFNLMRVCPKLLPLKSTAGPVAGEEIDNTVFVTLIAHADEWQCAQRVEVGIVDRGAGCHQEAVRTVAHCTRVFGGRIAAHKRLPRELFITLHIEHCFEREGEPNQVFTVSHHTTLVGRDRLWDTLFHLANKTLRAFTMAVPEG